MFGFSNKYALGHDIFSIPDDEENIVVFPNGNFVTDSVYYDSQKDTYFDLTDYENVAKYASCNQAYKNDPIPLYSDDNEGLFKFSESEYSADNAEARKNDGIVDDDYIQQRFDYASECIDVSNSIIYYDMIKRSSSGFDDDMNTNPSTSSSSEPFSPPDAIERKKIYAM
jgi:hypothetical protein